MGRRPAFGMEKALINAVNAGYTKIAVKFISYGDKKLKGYPIR